MRAARILILIAFMVVEVSHVCSAKERKVRNSEFELAVGGIIGHANQYGATPRPGGQLLLEYRYNIPESSLSLGAQASLGYFSRYDSSIDRISKVQNTGSTTMYLDYNFRIKEKFSVFTGLGAGLMAIDYEYPQWIAENTYEQKYIFTRSAVLNPRVGIEAFKHLRVTFEYKLMKKSYSYFGINIGFVIGGK